jgi:hypothetical protein
MQIGTYRRRHLWHGIPLAAYLVFAAMVSLAPVSHHSYCIMHNVVGLPCPFCGLTRAIGNLYHLEWRRACILHPMSVPFLVLGLALVTYRVICIIKPRLVRIPLEWELFLYRGVFALFIAVWLVRLTLKIDPA